MALDEPQAQPLLLLRRRRRSDLISIALHPRKPWVAIADNRGKVFVRDFDGRSVWESEAGLCCSLIVTAFAPDGSRLVAATDAECSWVPDRGWQPQMRAMPLDFRPTAMSFLPDSRTLVFGDVSGRVHVVDAQDLSICARHRDRPPGGSWTLP